MKHRIGIDKQFPPSVAHRQNTSACIINDRSQEWSRAIGRRYRDLDGWLPRNMPDPQVMEATGDLHHGIAGVNGAQAQIVVQDGAAFDGTDDMLDNDSAAQCCFRTCLGLRWWCTMRGGSIGSSNRWIGRARRQPRAMPLTVFDSAIRKLVRSSAGADVAVHSGTGRPTGSECLRRRRDVHNCGHGALRRLTVPKHESHCNRRYAA
jgi:hypothetical protein